jgi:hypothetical protein
MKFGDLAIGTAFEFETLTYTKTSPILAISSDGKSRVIRKSVVVRIPGMEQSTPTASPAPQLDLATVIRAFDVFYQNCIETCGDSDHLKVARQQFLNAIQTP